MNDPSIRREERGAGLALVGYRGTGKSTVGRRLADRLGRPFVDADLEIEARAGRSIRSIFEQSGESVFRDWEERVIREIAEERPGAVLATGGGAVLREINRRALRGFGRVVWLRASPPVLADRLQADAQTRASRPALTAAGALAEIADVLAARTPLYQEVADAWIETEERSIAEVVAAILESWPHAPLEAAPPPEPHSCS